MPIHVLPGRESLASNSTSPEEMGAETKVEGVTRTEAVGVAVAVEEKAVVAATEGAVETGAEAAGAGVVEAVVAEAGAGLEEVAVAVDSRA